MISRKDLKRGERDDKKYAAGYPDGRPAAHAAKWEYSAGGSTSRSKYRGMERDGQFT
jgi:hypothetical protein